MVNCAEVIGGWRPLARPLARPLLATHFRPLQTPYFIGLANFIGLAAGTIVVGPYIYLVVSTKWHQRADRDS
jgi:hypothetical protein